MALEGFRFTDLKRWKRGELMTMRWTGIYVPALNVQMDLDKDGTPDVIATTRTEKTDRAACFLYACFGRRGYAAGIDRSDFGQSDLVGQ